MYLKVGSKEGDDTDQFSMELLEQHNELLERLRNAKQQLDPVLSLVSQREHLLQLRDELDNLLRDPSRLTDRRNSHK